MGNSQVDKFCKSLIFSPFFQILSRRKMGGSGFRSFKNHGGFKIEICGLKPKRCSERDSGEETASNLQDFVSASRLPYPYGGVFSQEEMRDTKRRQKVPSLEEVLWKPKAGIVTAKSFHNNKSYKEFQGLAITGKKI